METEKVIRSLHPGAFPAHGFYGEETGQSALDAEYLWLVDPIDGTKAFVREYPLFSTQIALMQRGRLIVGVSSAPSTASLRTRKRAAARGSTTSRMQVSDIDSIEGARDLRRQSEDARLGPRWASYGSLVARANRIRGYGDFLHYHLLAAGKIDVVIESDVNILDIAALAVIVTEAGGRFTDLEGRQPGLATTSVLATNAIAPGSARGTLAVSQRLVIRRRTYARLPNSISRSVTPYSRDIVASVSTSDDGPASHSPSPNNNSA